MKQRSSSGINNNSEHQQPVIAPSTRRKFMRHKKQKRAKQMKEAITGTLLILMLGSFVIFALSYQRRLRRYTLTDSSLLQRTAVLHDSVTDSLGNLRGSPSFKPWVSLDARPFNEQGLASHAKHLIVVAGHSVVISGNLEEAGHDENVWFLLDYQRGRGLPEAIVAHIEAGIAVAEADPDSLLIFSGGETRAQTGPLTEGSSYFRVADAMDLWKGSNVRARTTTEEFATDSFENLLFSICRFYEVTGSYPTKITVVSFTFKQRRFETLHAPALHFPNFEYVGVDPPVSTGFDLKASTQGELENAARPFESDPYGCHTPVLQEKRKSRNPFSRTPPYELTNPKLKELLRHCGPELYPKEKLPWSHL